MIELVDPNDSRAVRNKNCPSANDLRQIRVAKIGVSGPSVC